MFKYVRVPIINQKLVTTKQVLEIVTGKVYINRTIRIPTKLHDRIVCNDVESLSFELTLFKNTFIMKPVPQSSTVDIPKEISYEDIEKIKACMVYTIANQETDEGIKDELRSICSKLCN
jgi:bifunctional DNA-binding transcriptional regulator/antitoxin component of YhaV-PrlF toxin-antitoxin module